LLNQFTIHELMALANRGIRIYEFGEGECADTNRQHPDSEWQDMFLITQALGHAIKDVVMSMPGKHNVENACVAISSRFTEWGGT
jgi:UDP-N-acetylmuramate-alanine ligase